jgi:hypothetical protein
MRDAKARTTATISKLAEAGSGAIPDVKSVSYGVVKRDDIWIVCETTIASPRFGTLLDPEDASGEGDPHNLPKPSGGANEGGRTSEARGN